ncbi:uncharacterized protein LOC116618759 isoform X1 [Nematostella vectensis]|uniref:uncharacterized protein LOC116618759 isoform X1 n=1 Tax=Nematostella vectensis TaxID=45351 RepID=UPI002076DD31|nr:uncharacterized protein LOC116618759 isoform X1 [Nematostella vectensis]
MVPKSRGKRKKSVEELLKEGRNLLDRQEVKSKRKRKPVRFLFSTDPATGLRNNKGTYKGQKKSKEKRLNPEFDVSGEETEETAEHCIPNDGENADLSDDFTDILSRARELLRNWEGQSRHRPSWSERSITLQESWESLRSQLFNAKLESFAVMPSQTCMLCINKMPSIQCSDCGPRTALCSECDISVHKSSPFHDRQALVKGHYVPIVPCLSWCTTSETWKNESKSIPTKDEVYCPECNHKCCIAGFLESHIFVVTMKGRFDLNNLRYVCTSCDKTRGGNHPIILVQLGFWPGSITGACYAFDDSLFVYWDMLQKQVPGISERAFLKSLEEFSKCRGRVGTVNPQTFRTAFREWKYCQFEIDKIRQLDWMTCPACDDLPHSMHVDGNMKLYRFASAGKRKADSYYGEAFIANNVKVDAHLQNVYQCPTKKSDSSNGMCGESNWRAAGNVAKKRKNLSETGLEIAGCRHALAHNAVNMFHGEIYGYAHYLQTTYFLPKEVEFFWYDVVCQYWPWLRMHDPDTASKMKPALSVMHAKAHSWNCQPQWGGRWQEGAAATTGEEVELINSHFSRLGSSTKHMLPEGREELLTEHAQKWNQRKIESLPRSLAQRYSKAEKRIEGLTQEISEKLAGVDASFEEWKAEVIAVARAEEKSASTIYKTSPEEDMLLGHIQSLGERASPTHRQLLKVFDIASKRKKELVAPCSLSFDVDGTETRLKGKTLAYLKQRIVAAHYAISQAAYNMSKMTDSGKQRSKLRKKISQTKTEAAVLVDAWEKLDGRKISMSQMEVGQFPWCDRHEDDSAIPVRTKRLLVDLEMERRRYTEERQVVKREMRSFLLYYCRNLLPSLELQKEKLEDFLAGDTGNQVLPIDITTEPPQQRRRYESNSLREGVLRGKLALVQQGIEFAMRQISSGFSSFAPVLNEDLEEFRDTLQTPDEEENEEEEDDEEESDESSDDEGDDAIPSTAIQSKDLGQGVHAWCFPETISQGTFNGRNGSSACSVIALVIGHIFWGKSLLLPRPSALLPESNVAAMCVGIEQGNRIYDLQRSSLPTRYLSIEEAAGYLAPWFDCSIRETLPVRLEDPHEETTIVYQLQNAVPPVGSFNLACLTISCRSALFVISGTQIAYFDSHSHMANHGALVLLCATENMRTFCEALWRYEGFNKSTYGNLSMVEFH